MGVPAILNSFSQGEVAPSLFGRSDLPRYRNSLGTCRNFFPSYRGPAYSRAGTRFCGYSKQTGRAYPPRLMPFQFSQEQGLALEFGNFYMRVIADGGFVTESASSIVAITQANPAVVTIAAFNAVAANANSSGVSASYNAGDTITLAGGTFSTAAVLDVVNTNLASIAVNSKGSTAIVTNDKMYQPGDVLTLLGGAFTNPPQLSVLTTGVVAAQVQYAGSGGTPGTQTVTGVSGTGVKFTASVNINSSGHITAVNSILTNGSYSANPDYVLIDSPAVGAYLDSVTGAGLTGAGLLLAMGVVSVGVINPGVFIANPVGGAMTQSASSGSGVGATFNSALFSPGSINVQTPGNYTVLPANPVAQGSTSGTGVGATFNLTFAQGSYNTGDWGYFSGVGGMTELNGGTYVLTRLTVTTYSLADVFGNPINSSAFPAFTAGGTLARVYTLVTPWAEADLAWLKTAESADALSICCVNQLTATEYAPQDLTRIADDNWTLTQVIPASTISPPASCTVSASAQPSGSTSNATYAYEVTAISPIDGTESIASPVGYLADAVNIADTAGTVTVTWSPVAGVDAYYVYKANPSLAPTGTPPNPPVGSLFGFAGQAYGTQFTDSNIVPDLQQVPPQHLNPFARGQLQSCSPLTTSSSGITSATVAINSLTGSGGIIEAVIVGGAVVAYLIIDAGQNYSPDDTVTVTCSGGTATATLVVGPETGTYPATASYFQERRCYANSLNNPDTYWMSQPGSYTNFDARDPPIADDALSGSPWGQEVNGIQWMVPTSGGLLVMTGLSAWLLVGPGSFATNVQAISPAQQNNVPQAFSGCSSLIPPIKVDYDVLYVDPTNTYYYDLPYQLYALSEPIDLTENSIQLFDTFTVLQHAWCRQPYKLLWAVRSDGSLLSLTYYKTQQVAGWARHDTLGDFVSCCGVREPPVDALYLATQRTINGEQPYLIERMDDRQWGGLVENAWCVDCGLSLAQPTPAANLAISSALGLGAISGDANLVGGVNYSAATTVSVVDKAVGANGLPIGSGALVTPTIVGGVITGLTINAGGANYQQPAFVVSDPAGSAGGSGFSATPALNNATALTASAAAFTATGQFVRAGGGIAEITAVTSSTLATANVLSPFPTQPNGSGAALGFASGDWTLSTPVTTVTAPHLAGMTLTGLADGNVIPPTVADSTGKITLPAAASAVTVGLGFQAQLQTVPIELGEPTAQGQRKKMAALTVRLEASRGVKVGANQWDGSTLSPPQLAPIWYGLQHVPDIGSDTSNFPLQPYNALATPLRTGDVRVPLESGWATPGQICVQQDNPLPCQVLALIPEVLPGDTPQLQVPQRQQRKAA